MSGVRVSRTTTATLPGGSLTLGDLRALLAEVADADDACTVSIRVSQGDPRDQRDSGSTTITIHGVA